MPKRSLPEDFTIIDWAKKLKSLTAEGITEIVDSYNAPFRQHEECREDKEYLKDAGMHIKIVHSDTNTFLRLQTIEGPFLTVGQHERCSRERALLREVSRGIKLAKDIPFPVLVQIPSIYKRYAFGVRELDTELIQTMVKRLLPDNMDASFDFSRRTVTFLRLGE